MDAKRFFLWGALCSQLFLASPGWGFQEGERIPDFALRTWNGPPVSRAGLAGKPALLVFWNTWCPNCRRELPQIVRLTARFGSKLRVVAVNTGLNDSEAKGREYWTTSGFSFPAGFDHSFEVGSSFRILGVPTVILVDGQGVVRYRGAELPANIEERIRALGAR